MSEGGMYLIVSEHPPTNEKDLLLFWAPDQRGYTVDVDKAGRYDEEAARRITESGTQRMVREADVLAKSRRTVNVEHLEDLAPGMVRERW
jgi:hypothetical protein